MQDQRAQVDWRDGRVPVSRRFDDPYFSVDDGLAETRHVFLAGNDLPARFCDGFHIAELGFGTGLNLLATLQAWTDAGTPGRLRFTSFEAFPLDPATAARALAAFPDLPGAAALLAVWDAAHRTPVALPGNVTLHVVTGDARATLPHREWQADAWFLDGFSPARNPELWEPALMAQVARHTAPGGTASSYSAAGHVRRALQDAGFTVTRQPGHGRKRHMTTARMPAPA